MLTPQRYVPTSSPQNDNRRPAQFLLLRQHLPCLQEPRPGDTAQALQQLPYDILLRQGAPKTTLAPAQRALPRPESHAQGNRRISPPQRQLQREPRKLGKGKDESYACGEPAAQQKARAVREGDV